MFIDWHSPAAVTSSKLGALATSAIFEKNLSAIGSIFWRLFGAGERRGLDRIALSDATLRFDLALGVCHRHAPENRQKKSVPIGRSVARQLPSRR